MTRRMILPMLFGLLGTTVLVGLGIWQVDRLADKEALLAKIETRIAAEPRPLSAETDPTADRYLPVTVEGDFTGEDLAVLASARGVGAIWRLVAVLETLEGRRILVDRGYVRPDAANRTAPAVGVRVDGNLHWPDETDRFTPAPDLDAGLWFARDVQAMAAELETEPVLIVAREVAGDAGAPATPLPVGTEGIPNDHLQYAITWFSLAAVWAGMTGYLLWRIRRRTV